MLSKTPRTQIVPNGDPNRQINQLSVSVNERLDGITDNPIIKGVLLTGVALANGTTTVNHTLNRNLIGWFVVGSNTAATIYDTQNTNATPNLTLVLVSNAAVTVNLFCF